MGYTDRREVKQFQFTAWPDHGVPEHSAPFLQFIRRIHMMNPADSGPIVTHCRFLCQLNLLTLFSLLFESLLVISHLFTLFPHSRPYALSFHVLLTF